MLRILILSVAVVFIVVGGLFLLTPIPLGIPLMGFGLVVAIAISRTAAGFVRDRRRQFAPVDALADYLERKGGARLRKVLRKTRPGRMPRISA